MIAYCLYVPGKILDPNHKFNQNCGFWILSVDLSVHNQYSDQSRKTGQCCCMSSSIVTLMITDDSLQRMLILLSPNPRIFYSCWNHMHCHFFLCNCKLPSHKTVHNKIMQILMLFHSVLIVYQDRKCSLKLTKSKAISFETAS